jgi:nucleotide-binding universal stress UspA family protein
MGAVVLGYVATAEGEAALRRAIDEVKLRDVPLIVVTSSKGGANLDAEAATELRAELAEVRKQLDASGVPYEVRNLVRGNEPAEDLIDIATQADADMIVIGLRRRSPVGKLIMGSNAVQILLDAPCPVLAVKV